MLKLITSTLKLFGGVDLSLKVANVPRENHATSYLCNNINLYFLGHFLHLCSIFYRQNNYVASGAGHEAICMTMGLIVFKNPPQQRKLKKPKNQLTESCKFLKSPAIVTPLEQQNILNYWIFKQPLKVFKLFNVWHRHDKIWWILPW